MSPNLKPLRKSTRNTKPSRCSCSCKNNEYNDLSQFSKQNSVTAITRKVDKNKAEVQCKRKIETQEPRPIVRNTRETRNSSSVTKTTQDVSPHLKEISTRNRNIRIRSIEPKPIIKECRSKKQQFSTKTNSSKPKSVLRINNADLKKNNMNKQKISKSLKRGLKKSSEIENLEINNCSKYENKKKSNLKKVKSTATKKQVPLKLKQIMKSKVNTILNVEHSPLKTKLRERQYIKYAESSLESTESEEKQDAMKKVPIYNQQINDEKPTKRKGDQYEFDSDSEKYRKKKKQKLDDSSFNEYNKTIQKILTNIMSKAKKQNKKIIFCDQKQKKKMKSVRNKHEANNNTSNLKSASNQNNVQNIKENTLLVNKAGLLRQSKYPAKKWEPKNNQNIAVTTLHRIQNSSKSPCLFDPHDDDDNFQNDEEFGSDDEYFGFTENENVKAPKIKVISDIRWKPTTELNFSIGTPTKFSEGKPNANSTMMNNVLTPWRFNEINIKRNPHFITLKPSSLPCINQEMVLDHSIVDKLGNTSKMVLEKLDQNNTLKETPKKSPVQTTLTKYVNSYIEDKENTRVSLFDSDQLSPVKLSVRSRAQRSILGEKSDNITEPQRVSTPVSSLRESHFPVRSTPHPPNDNLTNFGFDSFGDEHNKENTPTKDKDDRPFRLSINVNDKKYKGKQKIMQSVESDDESNISDLTDVENEVGDLKLFEDFASPRERLELHEVKVTKKTKKKDIHCHKKKKDVRSRKEEEEAEKWAAAFNSMCEEIEQFPLEIE